MYVYEISEDEYNAIDNMTPEEVETRYPYVDDMKHVNAVHITNPGKNLFDGELVEGNVSSSGAISTGKTGRSVPKNPPKVMPNTTYTITELNENAILRIFARDKNGQIIGTELSAVSGTFTTPNDPNVYDIVFLILTLPENLKVMLNIGSEPLPFEPQQSSYCYLPDIQLRSNMDGSVADQLYMDGEGKPRVVRRFREKILDGSLTWTHITSYTSSKQFRTDALFTDYSAGTRIYIINYNGQKLQHGPANSENFSTINSSNELRINIPNEHSGWGEDYTPTADEIKAYFYGWRMYNDLPLPNTYNGTGTKRWVILQVGRGQFLWMLQELSLLELLQDLHRIA